MWTVYVYVHFVKGSLTHIILQVHIIIKTKTLLRKTKREARFYGLFEHGPMCYRCSLAAC